MTLKYLSVFLGIFLSWAALAEESWLKIPGSDSVLNDLQNIELDLDAAQHALEIYSKIYTSLLNKDAKQYDSDKLKAEANEALKKSWAIRLTIHQRAEKWGAGDRALYELARNLCRVLRSIEDHLIEIAYKEKPFVNTPPVSGYFPQMMINPAIPEEALKIQSGDIFLTRGDSFTSAAIARMGDMDSQFSHAGFFYVDRRGRTYIVDSHIEDGSRVRRYHDLMKPKMGRVLILRHHDRAWAQRAAEWAYKTVLKGDPSKPDRVIEYDFSMQLEDEVRWYCTKLIRLAFQKTGPDKPTLPAFLSSLKALNPAFRAQMGLKSDVFFAPGDLEMDPSFHMVGEWRNPEKTAALRRHDAILSVLYEKLKKENVILNPRWWQKLGAGTAYLLRKMPFFDAPLGHLFPLNMERNTLEFFMSFYMMLMKLDSLLKPYAESYYAEHGIHPSYPELIELAEKLALDIKEGKGGCAAILQYFIPAPPKRPKS